MTKAPKILLDKAAFVRKMQRQIKDKEWANDVRFYELYKELNNKNPNTYSQKRMAELEAKYPGKLK